MPRPFAFTAPTCLALLAAGCSPAQDPPTPASTVATSSDGSKFDAIRADETISFLGTEPFWNGKVGGGQLTYSTPENEAGETAPARRFAGNNGLGFSGSLAEGPFDLTITPGECSDGMSDRMFPYTATLKIGERQQNGCAWTERQPYTGPENP